MLRAFTEDDPDGNGQNDTYGLGGDGYDFRSFWPWIQSYDQTHYSRFCVDDDGVVTDVVVRRYTVAVVDSIDTDLSSTEERNGASVMITLADLDDNEIDDYYDDYDDDPTVEPGLQKTTAGGTFARTTKTDPDGSFSFGNLPSHRLGDGGRGRRRTASCACTAIAPRPLTLRCGIAA